jgi:hypothetical protein
VIKIIVTVVKFPKSSISFGMVIATLPLTGYNKRQRFEITFFKLMEKKLYEARFMDIFNALFIAGEHG